MTSNSLVESAVSRTVCRFSQRHRRHQQQIHIDGKLKDVGKKVGGKSETTQSCKTRYTEHQLGRKRNIKQTTAAAVVRKRCNTESIFFFFLKSKQKTNKNKIGKCHLQRVKTSPILSTKPSITKTWMNLFICNCSKVRFFLS